MTNSFRHNHTMMQGTALQKKCIHSNIYVFQNKLHFQAFNNLDPRIVIPTVLDL